MNEIEERHAEAAIAFGVADDEAQVAFDQPAKPVCSSRSGSGRCCGEPGWPANDEPCEPRQRKLMSRAA